MNNYAKVYQNYLAIYSKQLELEVIQKARSATIGIIAKNEDCTLHKAAEIFKSIEKGIK